MVTEYLQSPVAASKYGLVEFGLLAVGNLAFANAANCAQLGELGACSGARSAVFLHVSAALYVVLACFPRM